MKITKFGMLSKYLLEGWGVPYGYLLIAWHGLSFNFSAVKKVAVSTKSILFQLMERHALFYLILFFYVLLTVHLSVILIINEINAQILVL